MAQVETLQVRIRCTPEAQDALSERLFEAGAGGVEERPHELVVYTDSVAEAALFEQTALKFQVYLKTHMPSWQVDDVEVSPLSSDWKRLWHEALETVQLTDQFSISPLKEGELGRKHSGNELFYRPEASFGSGSHPTTRLMAQGVEALITELGVHVTLFDVGTGNGVLCLLALALGLGSVSACDTSEIALESTRHNLQLNGYSEFSLSPLSSQSPPSKKSRGAQLYLGSADSTGDTFKVVLANIEAHILEEIAPQLRKRVAANGCLLLSGILLEQRMTILSVFQSLGLQLHSESELEGWVSLRFHD